MKFSFTAEDLKDLKTAEQYRFIQGNGLGGFMAATAAFSINRADDGMLTGAVQVPNIRRTLVHRLDDIIDGPSGRYHLACQRFADGSETSEGLSYLTSFENEAVPVWRYAIGHVKVTRRCVMIYGRNASIVRYTIENKSDEAVSLQADPGFLMTFKGEPAREKHGELFCHITEGKPYCMADVSVEGYDEHIYVLADGQIEPLDQCEEKLAYPEDAKDGRPGEGYETHGMMVSWLIPAHSEREAVILFCLEKDLNLMTSIPGKASDMTISIPELFDREQDRREHIPGMDLFKSPEARELCRAADLYLSEKEATGGYTLIAGYPLFGDWGRDTMISLPGIVLSTGRYKEAREIIQTFLKYEKNGLVPNLFPEKGKEPMYNSVDAPLLLIESVWIYLGRTGDWNFVNDNWQTLQNIISSYINGTDFNIHMDQDGLIQEGIRPWQLTWMDACIDGILPTPRYGKPVEINAFWYNALMIMSNLADRFGYSEEREEYSALARKVKDSFIQSFWMPEKGYLKDLVSGEPVDVQIRCNQIWALTMSYTMLDEQQEKAVLDTVTKHLFTTRGLRTLSPEDPEYHGYYGGPQFDRDMAYHQGTVWVYPMGAYYRAVLKCGKGSQDAIRSVKQGLNSMEEMLREGCTGQLPEIYDGDDPKESKGCYAQCWSVGEILRVYEELERYNEFK